MADRADLPNEKQHIHIKGFFQKVWVMDVLPDV